MWDSECVWILGASIVAFHRPLEQTSIVWEFPLDRPSVSIGEIGLTRPAIEKIFFQGGYLEEKVPFKGVKKFCSIDCENIEYCTKELLLVWEYSIRENSDTPIFEKSEYVTINKGSRSEPSYKRVKVKFGSLTNQQKKKFLLSRVKEQRTTIQEWKKITYERRNEIYNAAAMNPKFHNCLSFWKSNRFFNDHICDMEYILQAIDEGILSLTGSNNCLSTDARSPFKVDAGKGIELRTLRSHTRFRDLPSSFLFLSMRGNVYKMSFEGHWGNKGCLEGRVNHANSFRNNVGYREVNDAYNSKLYGISHDSTDSKYIVGGLHQDYDILI